MEQIQSVKNDRVKKWKKLQTRKGRDKTGTYLVEGFHLVEEALRQDGLVLELLVSSGVSVPEEWLKGDYDVFEISSEISHLISDTMTEQGVFAVVAISEPDMMLLYGKKLLLVDAVQDPGNVGTLIRTADAAGYDCVVLGRGSADLYNPKVIRSTQGSHFHIPVIQADLFEWVANLEEEGVPVIGAVLDDQAKSLNDMPKRETLALMVGNEGNGISEELQDRLSEKVYIPIYGDSESLNVAVAAGILLYGLRK
ncbi:TrmH family RNA methyltransferase [Listeria innocua]|uniref:TrmH family RNA methyltransferase n=1 Tax=Listeria innocua TaxID=1642 RepID=UPI0010B82868|nr:RNA methyltransferase [Listeria innocua]EAH4444402.1 RNA methyltransferase [Listeria innocua]ECJ9372111.1 RNA methyltransferase [Listeria innocua]EDO1163308.1 RNA methyltransferase [Listeria innocua]EDO1177779.1 RNA methyltransferase [Listeria innocua]EEU8425724.1 RNA methyltransferase [Listeria innocua]